LGNSLTIKRALRSHGVIVVSHFQGRETLVADVAGLVSPAPSAFPAPKFVVRHFRYPLSNSANSESFVILSETLFCLAKDPGAPRESPALIAGEENARLAHFLKRIAEDEPEKAA
jgi:hypothetical protein